MTKKTIVAMIPCRLGSQRVPKKNLRLLAGRTLSQWVTDACLAAKVFDGIYINSEAEVFGKMAEERGVRFYKRPAHLAANSATNDDFALDFMNNVSCDVLVQVNPTSPFTSPETMRDFVRTFLDGGYDTLHTVKNEQIHGLFAGKPLNFDPMKPMPPSQHLVPVQCFTCGMMAWNTVKFLENIRNLGCAVYGGDGKTGYYVMKGIATLDIDNEFDFRLAEVFVGIQNREPEYYEG